MAREGLTLNQFHRQIVRPDVVQVTDVRVVQGRDHSRLTFESLTEMARRHFDGNIATHTWIVRAVHFAHSADADQLNDFVWA